MPFYSSRCDRRQRAAAHGVCAAGRCRARRQRRGEQRSLRDRLVRAGRFRHIHARWRGAAANGRTGDAKTAWACCGSERSKTRSAAAAGPRERAQAPPAAAGSGRRLQAATAAAALAARGVGGHGRHVLNAANLEARARQRAQRRLGARPRRLRLVAPGRAQLDVQRGDAQLLQRQRRKRASALRMRAQLGPRALHFKATSWAASIAA